tara:strand:+ start:314 stop:760 length:447 start_codon:yes stop_codon:yes gene_type:complete
VEKIFKLRGVIVSDWDFLLEWRNDNITRQNSFNSEVISTNAHKEYINNILINSDRNLYILEYNEIPVGTLREDRIEKEIFELSYTISPMYRGKKIGQIMMSLYLIEKKGSYLCRVNEKNLPSIKMIKKLGFKLFKTENRINFYKINQS